MSKVTRATQALDQAGMRFTVHTYAYDLSADRIGVQAAKGLGVSPDREISMKKLAAAFGGKSARMMRPEAAERLTGYHVGGSAPLVRSVLSRPRLSRSPWRKRRCSSTAANERCRCKSRRKTPCLHSMQSQPR